MGNRDTLSIDIGTTSVKVSVIDEAGHQRSYLKRDIPFDGGSGNLAAIWSSYLKQLLPDLPGIDTVDAVCVTGNGPTLIPLDSRNEVCGPVISWVSTPSYDLGSLQSLYLPKLMHALYSNPEAFKSAESFSGCPEYISALLCGELATFIPDDRFIPYIWDDQQLGSLSLGRYHFPEFIRTGEPLGVVTQQASAVYGLRPGIPVVAGMTDFHAALIGCGCVHEQMTCDRAGTSEGINYISGSSASYKRLRTLPGITPGTWTVAGLMPASGEVFEWYRMTSGVCELGYDELMREILSIKAPEHSFFYPHSGGRHHAGDLLTGGDIVGEAVSDPIVRGRMVAEGIGFTVRSYINNLRGSGCAVERIRHCGGQARSPYWNDLKAQLLQVPVEVPLIEDAELLGCAAAARTGLGDFADLAEASDALVRIERTYYPDSSQSPYYEDSFNRWITHRI
jgi:xylulokinase